MTEYNKGQLYEQKIKDLLGKRNLLPIDLHGNDAGFFHNDNIYFVEVKNKDAPDFGQIGIKWSKKNKWEWRKSSVISEMFDEIKALDLINKEFIPRRHSKQTEKITLEDKKYDQRMIKQSGIDLGDINFLYNYYERKNCHYIQIEGKGFYYLKYDIARLNPPQFAPKLTFRLRAKTHHSEPVYEYSFFAVINANTNNIEQSIYDLEEKVGSFPPINNGKSAVRQPSLFQ